MRRRVMIDYRIYSLDSAVQDWIKTLARAEERPSETVLRGPEAMVTAVETFNRLSMQRNRSDRQFVRGCQVNITHKAKKRRWFLCTVICVRIWIGSAALLNREKRRV